MIWGSEFAAIWDVSGTQPLKLVKLPNPERFFVSPNGKFRVIFTPAGKFGGLEAVGSGHVICQPDDLGSSDQKMIFPRIQPFDTQSEHLFLTCRHFTNTPNWVPMWLSRQMVRRGYWQLSHEETMIYSIARGKIVCRMPANGTALWPAGGHRIWTAREADRGTVGIVFEEWPFERPLPPWWLCFVTAASVLFVIFSLRRSPKRAASLT